MKISFWFFYEISKHIWSLLASAWCSWDRKSSCDWCTDLSSWGSRSIWATWLGCKFCLILPVMKTIQAEHKSSEATCVRNDKRATVCGHHVQSIPYLEVTLLLNLYCVYYTASIVKMICTKAGQTGSLPLALPYGQTYIINLNWLGVILAIMVFF